MKTRLTVALLSVAIATQAFSGKAAATIVNLDELDIGRSGTTILDDGFDRNTTLTGGSGTVVPSGASFTDGTSANWFVQGSIPITTANNGQAQFNTANGILERNRSPVTPPVGLFGRHSRVFAGA